MPGFNISGSSGDSQPDYKLSNKNDVHRVHRWRIITLAGIDLREFYVYARSIALPDISFEQETITSGSLEYPFPKSVKWEDVTVAFYDTFGLYGVINTMLSRIWTPEDGLRPANEYMNDSMFGQTNSSGRVLDRFVLRNSWIKSVSHGKLTYESSDLKILSLTIAYSHAEHLKSQSGNGRDVVPPPIGLVGPPTASSS